MRQVAFIAALMLAGCAHRDGAPTGKYLAYGPALDAISPPVTLEVAAANRYTFCRAGRCVTGQWSTPQGPGRITFRGAELEEFVIGVSTDAFGPSAVDRQRGKLGFIELDYGTGPLGAQITMGAGDAAFVRQ